MKKKICLIYTGGTIGMVPSKDGYETKANYFEEILRGIPELFDESMPDWDFLEFSPLLDSSNIAVSEWNQIGRAIADRYEAYDGFVILHGTDTMAYTASALSFMLENLRKPVVLTGAQIPLCRVRSDARENLIASMMIAAEDVVQEVCLFFGGKLLRGNRAVKVSADGLQAFDSPNYPPLATAGIDIEYNRSLLLSPGGSFSPFHLTEFTETNIGVIKVFPGISFSLFEPIMTENMNGIVLETFGAGNMPTYDNMLLPVIRKAFESGTIVTVCSQCQQGTVHLGAYAVSSPLVDAGAVSGYDMTTEAAVAKLYYLFTLGVPVGRIKALMEQSLRGELSPMD